MPFGAVKKFRDSTSINNRGKYFKILLKNINYSNLDYAAELETYIRKVL